MNCLRKAVGLRRVPRKFRGPRSLRKGQQLPHALGQSPDFRMPLPLVARTHASLKGTFWVTWRREAEGRVAIDPRRGRARAVGMPSPLTPHNHLWQNGLKPVPLVPPRRHTRSASGCHRQREKPGGGSCVPRGPPRATAVTPLSEAPGPLLAARPFKPFAPRDGAGEKLASLWPPAPRVLQRLRSPRPAF